MLGNEINDKGLGQLLNTLGLKPGALYKIRFGGVVGKIAFICAVLAAPLAVIAWRTTESNILLYCLGSVAFLAILGIGSIVYFGHRHPLEATLEGGQIVALKELENQYAAKGLKEIPDQSPVARTIDVKALGETRSEETR